MKRVKLDYELFGVSKGVLGVLGCIGILKCRDIEVFRVEGRRFACVCVCVEV